MVPDLAGLPWLWVAGAAAVWVVVVVASPVHTCPRCHGGRTVRRGNAKRGRPVPCPVCGGRGIRVRPGASLVHRLRQWVLREKARKLPALTEEED